MSNKWYAIFSHTGSEIENIQKELNITPDAILTNNANYCGSLPALYGTKEMIEAFMTNVAPNSVITLNGYRNLISAETIDVLKRKNVKLVNIHPAPIYVPGYEDLRGLDPHGRYYLGYRDGKYNLLGVTLHEVDDGVDTGKVLYGENIAVEPGLSYKTFVRKLHDIGTKAWCYYLPILLEMED